MTTPIFVNEKPFDIHVSTPSGAGRIIPTGFAVSGDYFLSSWRNGVPLRKITEQESKFFDKNLILISINNSDSNLHAEIVDPRDEFSKPNKIEEKTEPKQSLEDSLNQAMKELGQKIPTSKELNKMSVPQLVELATKHNISPVADRWGIIK